MKLAASEAEVRGEVIGARCEWRPGQQGLRALAAQRFTEVIAESYDGGACLDPVAVTGAQVNGLPLGQFNPEADEQGPGIYNRTADLDPAAWMQAARTSTSTGTGRRVWLPLP